MLPLNSSVWRAALPWLVASLLLGTASSVRSTRELRARQDVAEPDNRWQPSAAALALALHSYTGRDVSENLAVDATGPQRTIMQCLGTTTLTRACHFENVYYNISGKRFVYFGPEGANSELFGQDVDGEPWLRLIGCAPT